MMHNEESDHHAIVQQVKLAMKVARSGMLACPWRFVAYCACEPVIESQFSMRLPQVPSPPRFAPNAPPKWPVYQEDEILYTPPLDPQAPSKSAT